MLEAKTTNGSHHLCAKCCNFSSDLNKLAYQECVSAHVGFVGFSFRLQQSFYDISMVYGNQSFLIICNFHGQLLTTNPLR